ncbi:coiled-coil domain-containing protein 92-like isoform X1 [Carassius auratus]|uniref:Coiled-coil domain-containing protein 92-like isoform X1 n=2 Tax=Carassius auratus TaxID=7957 RepID=A0A6P6QWX9_CARAU|nr:coiled-coil domain-containing protein 92-like isoform X1 [Carassius auratus]XP_052432897.1 coiled-coil domain-containing protein 92 isoform X1 [Carassius gibelio]
MENTGSQVVSLEQQVESVERSIVFLRQEQLSLLHGLHLEILSLQKRCTDAEKSRVTLLTLMAQAAQREPRVNSFLSVQELTQELNMKPPGRSEAEVKEEEEQLEARCGEVEEHLQEQQQIQSDLRWELSQKSVLVGALRASLKEKERHFLEELKHRSHRTTALNTELQKQTETAAYLSFQLHSAKQKLQQQRRRPPQPGADKPPVHPVPQASASSPTTIKPKRRSSSRPSSNLRTERARECVPRERVTGPEEPMAMPDPALFLYPYRHRSRLRPPHRHALPEAEGEESEELDQGASVSRLATTVAKATATTASTTENNAE